MVHIWACFKGEGWTYSLDIEFSKENDVIRASEAMTFEVTEPISSVLDISWAGKWFPKYTYLTFYEYHLTKEELHLPWNKLSEVPSLYKYPCCCESSFWTLLGMNIEPTESNWQHYFSACAVMNLLYCGSEYGQRSSSGKCIPSQYSHVFTYQ